MLVGNLPPRSGSGRLRPRSRARKMPAAHSTKGGAEGRKGSQPEGPCRIGREALRVCRLGLLRRRFFDARAVSLLRRRARTATPRPERVQRLETHEGQRSRSQGRTAQPPRRSEESLYASRYDRGTVVDAVRGTLIRTPPEPRDAGARVSKAVMRYVRIPTETTLPRPRRAGQVVPRYSRPTTGWSTREPAQRSKERGRVEVGGARKRALRRKSALASQAEPVSLHGFSGRRRRVWLGQPPAQTE